MGISRPFKRTVRQFINGLYDDSGRGRYVELKDYAQNPEQYIRAYLVIQKDFIGLLDYIEPSDTNLDTYSFRIHELLLRVCTEIEANLVAILNENGYKKRGNLNMNDYKKINNTHRLSNYKVKFPIWHGVKRIRQPFLDWDKKSLSWWKAYTNTKHNRNEKFHEASFLNLTDAISALIIVLSAQFMDNDFSLIDYLVDDYSSLFKNAIGDYFRVFYPQDFPEEERYNFSYSDLDDDDPSSVKEFDYNSI